MCGPFVSHDLPGHTHNRYGYPSGLMQGEGMKILAGIVAGITITIVVYAMKQPTLDMIFNRDQPRTPADWTPKMRVWIKGELQP